jgi:hypothetical protein
LSISSLPVRLIGDHSAKEEAVKFMLLIHQGTTPTPPSEEWERLSGVSPGQQLAPPAAATTVRVQGGKTLATDGPFVEIKEAIGGYLHFEADDLGRAVEVRPIVEW